MFLNKCKIGKVYKIKALHGQDDTIEFLNNLGCREGETIAVVSKIGNNIVFNVLDGRYGIDQNMAKLIEVE